jgi:hypothetical protein
VVTLGVLETMISRQTIVSLLFALLLGVGLKSWALGQRDDCDDYLAGDKSVPASQIVESGSRSIDVPCEAWIPRQSLWVQILCLLELVVIVVFAISFVGDLRDRAVNQRRGKG